MQTFGRIASGACLVGLMSVTGRAQPTGAVTLAASTRPAPAADPQRPALTLPRGVPDATRRSRRSSRLVYPSVPGAVGRSQKGQARGPAQVPLPEGLRLLPEGFRLANRDGVLSESKGWWLFSAPPAPDEPQVTVLRLLPCRALELVEATARRPNAPRDFRLSGLVTEYRGLNYLLLRQALLSSVSPPTSRPAARSQPTSRPGSRTPAVPSAAEVLEQLAAAQATGPRPLPEAVVGAPPTLTGRAAEGGTAAQAFPDGTILVDRVGRLVRESDWWTFTFETGGDGQAEPPIRLLPSRLLERMEIESTGGTDRVQFLVSGEVTTFRSMSFLLLRKVLRKRNLGNLR